MIIIFNYLIYYKCMCTHTLTQMSELLIPYLTLIVPFYRNIQLNCNYCAVTTRAQQRIYLPGSHNTIMQRVHHSEDVS